VEFATVAATAERVGGVPDVTEDEGPLHRAFDRRHIPPAGLGNVATTTARARRNASATSRCDPSGAETTFPSDCMFGPNVARQPMDWSGINHVPLRNGPDFARRCG
jgi:hypothetical protein